MAKLYLSSSSFLSVSPRWLSIEIGRRWASARVRWSVLLASVLVMALGLAWAVHAANASRQGRSAAEQEWLAFQSMTVDGESGAAQRTGNRENSSSAEAAQDFTTLLPTTAQLPDLVQTIQRDGSQLNVQLQGMQAKVTQSPSAVALGRSELVLNLRGTYPAVRQVLGNALARYPFVTMPALRLRRSEASTEVEATATLSVWTRPLGPPHAAVPLSPSVSSPP